MKNIKKIKKSKASEEDFSSSHKNIKQASSILKKEKKIKRKQKHSLDNNF